MEYKAQPEYEKCVAISTKASIREMLAPGAIALIVPVLVGFGFNNVFPGTSSAEILGGLLAGVTVSGVLMGIFQNNAGGAWDNAKKSFEKGVVINGETFYKKSEPHKASVTGDTVGDPFKDTSGPSMNILIKLMSIVSLVIAPHISVNGGHVAAKDDCCKKDKVEACCADKGMHHGMSMDKCDIKVCATMTKDECAKYCDSMGCDSACKTYCMSLYNDKGEFVGECMESCGKKCTSKEECMKNCGETCASKHMGGESCGKGEACGHHGDGKACAGMNGESCKHKAEGEQKACCKDKSAKEPKACCKDK
jgi:hypothetical protein